MIEGQVVFREQIHLERRSHRLGHLRLLGRSRDSVVTSEIAVSTPGHPLVRQPLLHHLEVAIQIRRNCAFEFTKQIDVGQPSHERPRNLK